MRQKMEFLNADLTEQAAPSDAELQAYLDANPEKFVRPDRVSFEQIYISPDRSGGDAEGRAAELLARIRADTALAADPRSLGDPTLLPPGLELAPAREIAGAFGSELAEAIVHARQGGWSGPHRSAYGLHLILVSDRELGGMPALAEIRPVVEREWSNERRQEANDRFYHALRDRYSVEIHLPAEEDENGLAEPAR
jgi:hypothetical protein